MTTLPAWDPTALMMRAKALVVGPLGANALDLLADLAWHVGDSLDIVVGMSAGASAFKYLPPALVYDTFCEEALVRVVRAQHHHPSQRIGLLLHGCPLASDSVRAAFESRGLAVATAARPLDIPPSIAHAANLVFVFPTDVAEDKAAIHATWCSELTRVEFDALWAVAFPKGADVVGGIRGSQGSRCLVLGAGRTSMYMVPQHPTFRVGRGAFWSMSTQFAAPLLDAVAV